MDSTRRSKFTQITIASVVILIVILFLIIVVPRTVAPSQHRITLRVESTSGSATIQYDAGQYQQKDPEKIFSTPWERTWVLESGTQVLLTAGNPQQMGTLKCFLKIDGANWKNQIATIPEDKVACGGIVR